jgi:hypothetical protein
VRISGGGGISSLGRAEVRWWMLPRYVREAFPTVGAAISRKRGGGWIDWDTGEVIRSQWPDHLPARALVRAPGAALVRELRADVVHDQGARSVLTPPCQAELPAAARPRPCALEDDPAP